MQDGSTRQRHKLYGGIAASVALHVLIAGLLLVQLPPLDFTPPLEETVTVEMVPPPEEEKPEEAEQEQALNVPEMEEQAPQEEQQPPPPEEQQAAEPAPAAGGEPPPPAAEADAPEEQPAEPPQQADAAEPPPPPPAETETVEAAEPPPEAPPAEEQQSTQPPEAGPPAQEQAEASQAGSETPGSEEAGEQEAGRGQPLPTLRPVFEYGEEASGSGMARGGNASEGEAAEESETADLQESTPREPPNASEPAEPEAADAGASGGEGEVEQAAPKLPDDIETPSVDMSGALPLPSSEEASAEGTQLAAEPAPGTADGEATPENAEAKPAEPSEDGAQDAPPRPTRRLFSEEDTGSRVARTAMGNVPRDVRGGQLCSTELTEQLRHGSQRFNPDIIPAFKLPEGTVLDVRQAAFRSGAQWYDVRFRCEVNENATRVVSFGLDIGEPVPRSEWRARRFPEY